MEMLAFSPAECVSRTDIFEVYTGHHELFLDVNGAEKLAKLPVLHLA